MNLYDRLLRYGTEMTMISSLPDVAMRDLDRLPEAVVYRIDNVTEYLSSLGDDQRSDFALTDLPTIVPPHPVCFVETRRPSSDDWWFFREWKSGEEWGALLLTYDWVAEGAVEEGEDGITIFIPGNGDDGEPTAVEARWTVVSYWFIRAPGRRVVRGPLWSAVTHLDVDGRGIKLAGGRMASTAHPLDFADPDRKPDGYSSLVRQFGLPIFTAFAFCHCKNVRRIENEGRYPSRQMRRAAERKGEPPPTRFYTIEIDPMREVLKREGQVETLGLKKALHICRGHFAEYGDEFGKGKLFGRYEGRFWVPAHVRGSAESGMVGKDYAVKAPKDAA
jgi:hypothetical protein